MATFTGYEKMADSPAAWRLDPASHRALSRVPWIVTEKIHGANFSFLTDGETVECANRREILNPGDPFFDYESVRNELADAVRETFRLVRSQNPNTRGIQIFGELFGGGYPHPDVPAAPGAQPIQTGVWYAPDIRFCALDLRVEAAGSAATYLDYERAMPIFEQASLPYSQPLFTGSWEKAQSQPIWFDSTIPATLDLPPLPGGSNPAEGIVIKPLRERTLNGIAGPIRPIFKRKIAAFAEDRRFHQAQKWSSSTPMPTGLDSLKWEVYNRVVESRLDNAVSKIGRPSPGQSWPSALFSLLLEEVLSEAIAVEQAAYEALPGRQQAELRSYATEQIGAILKERFNRPR